MRNIPVSFSYQNLMFHFMGRIEKWSERRTHIFFLHIILHTLSFVNTLLDQINIFDLNVCRGDQKGTSILLISHVSFHGENRKVIWTANAHIFLTYYFTYLVLCQHSVRPNKHLWPKRVQRWSERYQHPSHISCFISWGESKSDLNTHMFLYILHTLFFVHT